MKIVVLDGKTMGENFDYSRFQDFGELIVYNETDNSEVAERIKNAEIVIDNKSIIDEKALENCQNLKLIALLSTGTNVVDIEFAKKKNIAVCNVAGYSTVTVAQHTFAMLFELIEKISLYDDFVKSGQYSNSGMFTSYLKPYNEISGKTWGIIGMGNIGQAVAKISDSFGANVCYYSITGSKKDNQYQQMELDELLQKSDIVSVHCALSDKTKNLIDYDKLCKMKKNAIIINVGRGGIINENDLAKALDEDIIAGACVDVFEKEPINLDNPLPNIKNRDKIILTPHIAWASIEARGRLINEVYLNIKAFIGGENRNRVV